MKTKIENSTNPSRQSRRRRLMMKLWRASKWTY